MPGKGYPLQKGKLVPRAGRALLLSWGFLGARLAPGASPDPVPRPRLSVVAPAKSIPPAGRKGKIRPAAPDHPARSYGKPNVLSRNPNPKPLDRCEHLCYTGPGAICTAWILTNRMPGTCPVEAMRSSGHRCLAPARSPTPVIESGKKSTRAWERAQGCAASPGRASCSVEMPHQVPPPDPMSTPGTVRQ